MQVKIKFSLILYKSGHLQYCVYSGPALAMVLCGPRAIEHWIELLGSETFPERSKAESCLRSRFGTPGDDARNGLHGSENEMEALRELHFFFPDCKIKFSVNVCINYPHGLCMAVAEII